MSFTLSPSLPPSVLSGPGSSARLLSSPTAAAAAAAGAIPSFITRYSSFFSLPLLPSFPLSLRPWQSCRPPTLPYYSRNSSTSTSTSTSTSSSSVSFRPVLLPPLAIGRTTSCCSISACPSLCCCTRPPTRKGGREGGKEEGTAGGGRTK